MRWRIVHLRIAGLLTIVGVNAALLAKVTTQVVFDDQVTIDKVAGWNAQMSGLVASAGGRKPLEAYGTILAHPVFFKTREPFVPAPPKPTTVAVATPPVVDPGLVVGGIMIMNGLTKAYMLSRASATGAWTSEGDEYMGWQIRSISKTGAKLEQNGRSIDLLLYPRE